MTSSDVKTALRGRMNDAEKAEIERLISEVRLSSPLEIARLINRLPGTVYWYMVTNGLFERRRRRAYRVFPRKGAMVHGFTELEDRMIEEMRVKGHTLAQIAECLTREFGHKRSYQSVQGRLAFLAAEPDECDMAAAAMSTRSQHPVTSRPKI